MASRTKTLISLFKSRPIHNTALVEEVLQSGYTGEGPFCEKLYQKLCKFYDTHRIVLTNSCTSAIALAAYIADCKQYCIPTYTMIATAAAVKQAGKDIILCDVLLPHLDCVTPEIDHKDVGLIEVAIAGYLPRFKAERATILDMAHGIKSYTYEENDRIYKLGPMPHEITRFCCYSLQSIKHVSAGDGGFLICRDEEDYQRAKRLKWFGLSRDVPKGMGRLKWQMTQDVPELGFKYHMNDVAAAIALTNWDIGMQDADHAGALTKLYRGRFQSLKSVDTMFLDGSSFSSCWGVPIFCRKRNSLMDYLANLDRPVQSSPMWKMLHEHSAFTKTARCSNSDSHAQTKLVKQHILFLPNHWDVRTRDVEYITDKIRKFYK